ncbi:MAG: T9SS type A sorting domain-containing protein [Flavobacteriales bacterium]|nr:T9SS type A sorting domain-containing protein [Flavobacteriales bacterium]
MRNALRHGPHVHRSTCPILFFLSFLSTAPLAGQTLHPDLVSAGYTLADLGGITNVPASYGGLTIRSDQPNTLYIGGTANQPAGAVYTVPLVRDAVTNSIIGFAGPASFFVDAPHIDGGLSFTPSGTLMFTQYTPSTLNSMGQILPDNSYVTTQLTSLGVSPSVGSHAFVPAGYPGAGSLIVASYNAWVVYQIPYAVDANGLHSFSAPTAQVDVTGAASGPEGIAYVPIGSAAFPNPSMVISAYGLGKVVAFDVDLNGLPITSTARDIVTGLTGAEGAWIDPVTGDFLFSTFGGSNRVIRVSGFEAPSSIGPGNAQPQGSFTVFPNPSNGLVQLSLPGANGKVQLEVIDPLGALVLSREFAGGNLPGIDLGGRTAGVYAIRVWWNGTAQVKRVLVE